MLHSFIRFVSYPSQSQRESAVLPEVILRKRDPKCRSFGKNRIIENILGVVDHGSLAVSQEAVTALLLLEHKGEILTSQISRPGKHHVLIPEHLTSDRSGLGCFGRI